MKKSSAKPKVITILFMFMVITIILTNCTKEIEVPLTLPVISTSSVSNIEPTQVISGGFISFDGGAAVTNFGVCWGPNKNPTVNDSKTSDGSGTGQFTSTITGLSEGTAYHVRAYATNSVGTAYGSDLFFTTALKSTSATLTQPATNISTTSATLNGIVYPKSVSTVIIFEYGITTSYGQTANAIQSPATGSLPINVSQDITSLNPGTVYHFRVKIVNSLGTVYGGDMVFRTISQTSAQAVTLPATGITDTGATLNGSINPNSISTTVTFEYGTTTSYGQTVTSEQSPATGNSMINVSKDISALSPGTTYHFRVKTVSPEGTVVGGDMVFTTTSSISEEDYVLNNIMTGLKFVERLKSATAITINQASMLSAVYSSCTKIGDFIVYTKQAQSLDATDWTLESGTAFTGDKLPSNLQIKFAWKSDGTVYMGAVGTDNEVLAATVELGYGIGEYGNTFTLLEQFVGTELKLLRNASFASGVPTDAGLNNTFFTQLTTKYYNRFSKPIYRVYSALFLTASPANITLWSYGPLWCPYPGNSSGSGSRSFSLTFSNATNSYVSAAAGNDNGNSSYVKFGGTTIAQMSKWYANYYRRTAIYPATIEMGATISWSQASPYVRMAFVADNVAASSVTQTPSGGLSNNKAPVIIVIPVY